MSEEIEKVAGRITTGLNEVIERGMTLMNQVKTAKEISGEQLKELADLAKLMSELAQRYPYPKAKSGVAKDADTDDIPAIPKAIRERADALVSGAAELGAADQNGVTTTRQSTGATDPATPPTSTPPPDAKPPDDQTRPPDGTASNEEEVVWPADLAPDPATSTDPVKHWGHTRTAETRVE
jgi:hypothetical protein